MSSSSQLAAKNKRKNATLSCAECRRLKLRCSRQFPCASCVKKGCAAICPDGSLTTGKGNRFVLANTEQLHDKITLLANRVRQLEDGLAHVYARVSDEQHPLLTDELRQLKRPLERESPEEVSGTQDEEEVDVVESINVGSLSIAENGTRFFGGGANAWYLLQNEAESDQEEEDEQQLDLPAEVESLSHSFLFASSRPETASSIRMHLVNDLPDAEKARHLAETYFKYAAWMYTPVPAEEFYEAVFPQFYGIAAEGDSTPLWSHRLGVLYLVFALGSLSDPEKPTLSPEGAQYYQLARAALSLDSILESPTMAAIQALVLMCHYMFWASFAESPRWALMGLVVKLAQGLGLHRDSGRWNLDPKETFQRRSLFYELYTYDTWQSLQYGRPPSFSNSFIDCQMPHEPVKNDSGEVEMSFAAWKHRFSFRCQNVVFVQAFGAKVPEYRTIQELDSRVRNFYVPPSLRVPGFGGTPIEAALPPVELTLQRYTQCSIKEITLFYLHRGFFAKALEDHPEDPLGSKYAPSVLAAYNSACSYVGMIKSLYSQHPRLMDRFWFLFMHVFSCAIVLGSIAAKCPKIALAPSAMSHLESALWLFNQVSEHPRKAKVLPVLQKLKARAKATMDANRNAYAYIPSDPTTTDTNVKIEDEAFAALGGKTRLVSRRSPPAGSTTSASPQTTPDSPTVPGAASPEQTFPALFSPASPDPPSQLSYSSSIGSDASTRYSTSPTQPYQGMPGPSAPAHTQTYNGSPDALMQPEVAPHMVVEPGQWNAYLPPTGEYDYSYPVDLGQWQQPRQPSPPDTQYSVMAVDVHGRMPAQYLGYEQMPPSAGHDHGMNGHYLQQPQQAQQQSMASFTMHNGDRREHQRRHAQQQYAPGPTDAWNYLVAQYQ